MVRGFGREREVADALIDFLGDDAASFRDAGVCITYLAPVVTGDEVVVEVGIEGEVSPGLADRLEEAIGVGAEVMGPYAVNLGAG